MEVSSQLHAAAA